MIKIIGHRGCGATANRKSLPTDVFPENTLIAFEHALQNKANGIEFDVYGCRDEIIVIHSDDLSKHSFFTGFVSDFKLDQLKEIEMFHGAIIPTLDEVLDLVKNYFSKDIMINIEIKGNNLEEKISAKIKEFIKETDFGYSNFLFNSFDWDKVKRVKKQSSDFQIGLNLKSKLIFGEENINMPGYLVKDGAKVSAKLFEIIKKEQETFKVDYIDCVIGDLRKDILHFCSQNNIGISTSCPNERTGFEQVKNNLNMLLEYQDYIPNIIFKADDVKENLKRIKQ